MRRTLAFLLFLASLSIPMAVDAAPNCKKGVPCGNACISKDKTCRK